jgi:hypothetical protein
MIRLKALYPSTVRSLCQGGSGGGMDPGLREDDRIEDDRIKDDRIEEEGV